MKGKGIYYYNEDSKTLHIRGCCKNSKSDYNQVIRYFDTEKEVLAYAGLSFKWCEECVSWREKLIQKAINEREEEKK